MALDLLEQASIKSMETRARINKLRNLYYFINRLFHVNSAKYKKILHQESAGINHRITIKQYNFRHDGFRYYFFLGAIDDWDFLPNEVITLPPFYVFVEAITSATSKCSSVK